MDKNIDDRVDDLVKQGRCLHDDFAQIMKETNYDLAFALYLMGLAVECDLSLDDKRYENKAKEARQYLEENPALLDQLSKALSSAHKLCTLFSEAARGPEKSLSSAFRIEVHNCRASIYNYLNATRKAERSDLFSESSADNIFILVMNSLDQATCQIPNWAP